jgi:hypothetical protein
MSIRDNNNARVSFAVVGVLILIIGSFSAAYLASVNMEHTNSQIEESHLRKMRNVASLIHEEIKTQAYYKAQGAIYTANQVLYDQSKIMPLFNETFADYVTQNFPRKEGNLEIKIGNYTTGIFFDTLKTIDIVPSNKPQDIVLKGKGKEVKSKTVESESAGIENETSMISYYSLSGQINYTIYDTKSSRFLKKEMHFEKRMESIYPLLHSKLTVFDASANSVMAPIPRTIKYILTTLAQYRVLMGYGMEKLSGAVLDIPQKDSQSILTKHDIELALNLAVLLETARLFRTYDKEALSEIDENVRSWNDEEYSLVKRNDMEDLVKNYINNKTIDAADIIALYIGLDIREIEIEAIFAQALFAMADQFMLKYLDYFHLMDALDVVFFGVQFLTREIERLTGTVDDIFGFLTQKSQEDDNLKRLKDWVRKTLTKSAGLLSTEIMHNTSIYVSEIGYQVTLTQAGECVHLEDTDNNASTPDEEVVYPWSIEGNYEVLIGSESYDINFLKKDILRDEVLKLWYDPNSESDFYDLKFKETTNDIFISLKTAIKLVIAEVVALLGNMVELDLTPYKFFSRPENLNPKDNVSLLEEVKEKVNQAISAIKIYFSGDAGKERLRSVLVQLLDEHAHKIGELQNFIIDNFDELAGKEDSILSATTYLTNEVLSNSQVQTKSIDVTSDHPDCVPQEPFSESDVRTRFENTRSDDVEDDMQSFSEIAYAQVRAQELSTSNNGKNQKPLYIIGALQNAISQTENIVVDLFTNMVYGFGFVPMGCDMVSLFAGEIIYGGEVVNTKFLGYTKLGAPFEFWEEENRTSKNRIIESRENIEADQKPNYLKEGKNVHITLSKPEGIHYTIVGGVELVTAGAFGDIQEDLPDAVENIKNSYKTRPYVTNWGVKIQGQVKITTRSQNKVFLSSVTHLQAKANKTVRLDMAMTITVYSGWNLEGIDYELSNTLADDILEFLNKVWDYIVSIVGAVFDFLGKLTESFVNLLTQLISYVADLVKLIVDTIEFFIQLVRDFIQTIMDTIVKDLIETIADIIDNGFTISVFGFTFSIIGNKTVATNSSLDGDLLKVTTKGSIFDLDLNFTVRFSRYHKEDDDNPHYDVLINTGFHIGDFNLDLTIDPLMAIQSYIVEGHGQSVNKKGSGWGIDIYAPEIEEYKEVSWKLSDYTSGLTSIPIPFLGLKATIDCGFIIQYNAPKGTDVVINEFELNPAGEDKGFEWFEIYNPENLTADNWSVSSINGKLTKMNLSSLESEIDGEYTVFTIENESLDNGKSKNPFSKGDGLILYDENGTVIDRTPAFKDPGLGDSNTWQRTYDGGSIWQKKEKTQLASNGEEKLDIKQQIIDALKSSFQIAWNDFVEKDFSLDAIIDLVKDWIHNFIEMVLTLIYDVVQKVYVFLDLLLEDATGSAGGGIRISLGMDNVGLDALLRWIIKSIETFFYNITNPANPENYPTIPKDLPEHMFIQFEVYLFMGTPNLIKKVSEEPPERCRLSIAVSANIPALVNLLGWDWGDWEVVFGAYLDHFPSKALSNYFGTSDNPDNYVNLWLFRARIYEIA